MAQRLANPAPRHFDDNGKPLSGGKLFFFVPDSLTAKDTFSDNALTIANTNPVILTASGLQPNVFLNGSYRVILAPSTTDNSVITGGTFTAADIIWDRDNVNAIVSPFSQWIPSLAYGVGGDSIVTGSDGKYYISLVADNLGNDPISSPGEWQEISFLYGDAEAGARAAELGALDPDEQAVIIGDGANWQTMTLASMLPKFISGVELSNATDAEHDITVSAGRANDSTDALSLVLASAMTKQIDATWVAGNNTGGLASGATLANNAWYHVFLVRVGSAIDVMFDSSVACANGVANNAVTHFRRIGSVKTDGSANIVPFIQDGDEFTWSTMVQDVNAVAPAESAVTAALTVPTGVVVIAKFNGFLKTASTDKDGHLLFSALSQFDVTPSQSQSTISTFPVVSGAIIFNALVYVLTNTSAQIRYRLEVTTTGTTDFTVLVNTLGWIDMRGK